VPAALTISVTNVRAEQSDQDPHILGRMKTITEVKREGAPEDAPGAQSTVFPR